MKYLADGDRFVRSTVCHRGKYFELAARQSGVPGTISLEQIIGKRCFGEQRHEDVGRDDNKPGDSRLDGCDDFIAAWYRKRATARTENRHSNDTPLQIDERTAFGGGTECQIKANEPIDGATANAVPSPARESDDAERGERRTIVISHRDDDMTSAQ